MLIYNVVLQVKNVCISILGKEEASKRASKSPLLKVKLPKSKSDAPSIATPEENKRASRGRRDSTIETSTERETRSGLKQTVPHSQRIEGWELHKTALRQSKKQGPEKEIAPKTSTPAKKVSTGKELGNSGKKTDPKVSAKPPIPPLLPSDYTMKTGMDISLFVITKLEKLPSLSQHCLLIIKCLFLCMQMTSLSHRVPQNLPYLFLMGVSVFSL